MYLDKEESKIIHNIYYGSEKTYPRAFKYVKFSVINFDIKTLNKTDIPLAIDFGTSNTTAGIYIANEIGEAKSEEEKFYNDIKVLSVIGDDYLEPITKLIPTVVAVKANKKNDIKYYFGYEAMKLSKSNYLEDRASVFYDIKRWVSDFEKSEIIFASNGEKLSICRKDIIKSFFKYIIETAQQQFKYEFRNIHITCPMKQKNRFLDLFKNILGNYHLEANNLDEGSAILFNSIYSMIEEKKFKENEEYKALIIDCGGGTTDLSTCKFKVKNTKIAYSIDIETFYENGDTDFGGNNLTFRLLEFLKICFYEKISNNEIKIKQKILKDLGTDTYRNIDEFGQEKLYLEFEKEYKEVEKLIPTRFKDYEKQSNEEYLKVKGNFYFLFNLAEMVKKVFFTEKFVEVKLLSNKDEIQNDNEIFYNKWQLHVLRDSIFMPLKEGPKIDINIYEINALLKGDIYNLIKKFIEDIYFKEELFSYSLIKLTGQSCNIDIFRDSLKEFIPGRLIYIKHSKKNDYQNLKLTCLRGALKYLKNKKFGYIDVNIKSNVEALPYIVTAYTHNGEEKVLIKEENDKGSISRFKEEVILNLFLKDKEGNILHKYVYENNLKSFTKKTYEEIEEKYLGIIFQDETDVIVDKEIKFFVYSINHKWGFCVVPVLREKEKLFLGQEKFYNYENDMWERNFFDGLK